MNRVFLVCIGAFALAVVASPVRGADLKPVSKAPVLSAAPVASSSWTGLYVGAHAGYGWGDTDFSANVNGVRTDFGSHNLSGAVLGGQVGYNYQFNSLGRTWVAGLEFQASRVDLDGSHGALLLEAATSKVESVSALAGRLGFVFDRYLIYAKSGVAWARAEYSFGSPVAAVANDVRVGVMGGIGVEYGFTPNWSVRLDYSYLHFGKKTLDFPCIARPDLCGPGVRINVGQEVQLFTVGLNYRFNPFGIGGR